MKFDLMINWNHKSCTYVLAFTIGKNTQTGFINAIKLNEIITHVFANLTLNNFY